MNGIRQAVLADGVVFWRSPTQKLVRSTTGKGLSCHGVEDEASDRITEVREVHGEDARGTSWGTELTRTREEGEGKVISRDNRDEAGSATGRARRGRQLTGQEDERDGK